ADVLAHTSKLHTSGPRMRPGPRKEAPGAVDRRYSPGIRCPHRSSPSTTPCPVPHLRSDGQHHQEDHRARIRRRPAAFTVPEDWSCVQSAYDRAENSPDSVAFQRPVDGRWTDVTAREFADTVRSVGRGLIATGVEAGD